MFGSKNQDYIKLNYDYFLSSCFVLNHRALARKGKKSAFSMNWGKNATGVWRGGWHCEPISGFIKTSMI